MFKKLEGACEGPASMIPRLASTAVNPYASLQRSMNCPVVSHKDGQSVRELTANIVEKKVKVALLPNPDWLAIVVVQSPINKPGIEPQRRHHAFTRQ